MIALSAQTRALLEFVEREAEPDVVYDRGRRLELGKWSQRREWRELAERAAVAVRAELLAAHNAPGGVSDAFGTDALAGNP